MTTTTRRTFTAMLAAVLLLAGLGTAATAAPQGYETGPLEGPGRFYGDFEEVLLFGGAPAEAWCHGDEGSAEARVFHRRDGSIDVKVDAMDYPLFLYAPDGPAVLDAPVFLDQTCAAIFDGDPATNPLEPFAVGTGNLKVRATIHPDGLVEESNSVNGMLTGADGTQWKVRAWADFAVDDGVLLGDPTEFVGFHLTRVGG